MIHPENYSIKNSKSTTSLTTPVFKKVPSIFTALVPRKYINNKNSKNFTQINLLVQGIHN